MNVWVDVAVLTGTKTLDGRLVVRSAPGLPFLLSRGMQVYFVPPVLDVPRTAVVEEIAQNAGDSYLVRFSSLCDKTTAGKLLDCHVLVRKDDLDSVNAALAEDSFLSYAVEDVEMGSLGVVTTFEQMPGQFLLRVVSADGSTFSIPFVDEFILDVNQKEKIIHVDIPVGLLEL